MDNDHWLILDFFERYKCLRFYPESTNFITSGDLRFLWYIIKKSPSTPVVYLTFTSTTILYDCPGAWWSEENFCTCGVKSGNKEKIFLLYVGQMRKTLRQNELYFLVKMWMRLRFSLKIMKVFILKYHVK